jgi:hypothetical protein
MIFILDTKDKKKTTGNNIEKHQSNFKEIEIEAVLLTKKVSDSYSEAIDTLKSKLLLLSYIYMKNHTMIII